MAAGAYLLDAGFVPFREALEFLSAEDKEWILGKALAEVFRWPEGRRFRGSAIGNRRYALRNEYLQFG